MTNELPPTDLPCWRLGSHGLGPARSERVAPLLALSHFAALQAQDAASAHWALGLRARSSEAEVTQALQARELVRSWTLRGTLHLMPASDLRWLLAAVGPTMLARGAATFRRLGLDEATLARVDAVLLASLQGGRSLSRSELFAALAAHDIETEGVRGNHLLYRAAWRGMICLGNAPGRQAAYVLLDEWLPPAPPLPRQEALAALALRYFRSHGPATLRDFAWWAGLGQRDARDGLDGAAGALRMLRFGGVEHWCAPECAPVEFDTRLHLLPAFDEYFLGYADRSPVLAPALFPAVMTVNGIFRPTLLHAGRVVGTWSRSLVRGALQIDVTPFEPLQRPARIALDEVAQHYAAFLGQPLAKLALA